LIDHSNLEGFDDPANYDIQDHSDTGVAFYSQLAQETGSPVLEIGCGTGRVSIPIARLGISVTGLDIVPGMVAHARMKAAGLPTRWIEGDARNFVLHDRFRLIYMTGNVFQAFLTRRDLELVFERVRTHLQEDGLLAFETRNPRWPNREVWAKAADTYSPINAPGEGFFAYLETCEKEQYQGTYTDAAGHEVRVSIAQVYDHVEQVMHWTGYRRWMEGNEEKTKVTRTAARFTFPQELEALLFYNGFSITRQYGDWNLEPLGAHSPSIIVVCRKGPQTAP
jgi:ubiquinone/menaquinone biosynthesis C-methylase UbiE